LFSRITWQGLRRMRDCRSSSKGGGGHRGPDYLCVGCTCLERVSTVDLDAIRALSPERDGDSNQLFVLCRDCSMRRPPCQRPNRPSSLAVQGRPFSSAWHLPDRCEWKGSFCFPRSKPPGFDRGVYLGSVARLLVEFICFDAFDWSEELSAPTSWPRSWTERLALRSPPPEPR